MTDRDEKLESQLRARPLPGLSDEARQRLLAELASATMAAPSGEVMDRVSPAETDAHPAEAIREADASPIITLERTRKMKRIVNFAVAATVLVGLGILISWTTIGGSNNIAFAQVSDALDNLRSATYDVTSKGKQEKGQPLATATGKGFFLAPSHQRIDMSLATGPTKNMGNYVTIVDGQAAKSLMLLPNAKLAVSRDMKTMREDMKKWAELATDPPADVFETVRRLVREGSSGTGEQVERLGKKEIDGREAIGFRVNANTMDMTLWADPETAWPIRIEIVMDLMPEVRLLMNNFRYNVELDPSLFSLEPPAGYATQTMEMTMPLEEDLLGALRTIAEHGKGVFPAKLEMNKEVMELLMAGSEPKIDKHTEDKIESEMNKIAAKYGGKDKLREKYGKDIPPEIAAEIQKAVTPLIQKQMQEQMPLMEKRIRGITFYTMLKPENNPHYVGGGVKLGTADRPILWYKPTGADKYRVIYGDLSVKEMTPDDAKNLPEAKAK